MQHGIFSARCQVKGHDNCLDKCSTVPWLSEHKPTALPPDLQTWAYLSHCRATTIPVSKWSVLPSGGQGYFEAFVHIFPPICRNLLSIPLQMSHWKCLDFQQIGTLSDGLMKSMETCSRGSKVLRHWCPPLGRRWLQCIMVWIFVKHKNVHVAT